MLSRCIKYFTVESLTFVYNLYLVRSLWQGAVTLFQDFILQSAGGRYDTLLVFVLGEKLLSCFLVGFAFQFFCFLLFLFGSLSSIGKTFLGVSRAYESVVSHNSILETCKYQFFVGDTKFLLQSG